MANLLDYLIWRGDLTWSQSPFGDVDSLILTTLTYTFFDGIVPEKLSERITLSEAAEIYFSRPQEMQRARVPQDADLLRELAKSRRFAEVELCGYVNKLDFAAEKQFSAMTMILGDGTVFVGYRGTDHSLVGWKEDFNMSFMDAVPSQWDAEEYLQTAADRFPNMLRVGGHSKGGNLAVYAAATCPEEVQNRILSVYNHDGPGFRENMLQSVGYQRILPRVQTFVPQSSIIGMLLEHEEEYTVVQSDQSGILQHDPYSWEVLGPDFIRLEKRTEQSEFLDKTVKRWLDHVDEAKRASFIDTVYAVLTTAPVDDYGKAIVSLKAVLTALQALIGEDEETKKGMSDSMKLLLQAAGKTAAEYANLPRLGKGERGKQNEK